MRSWLPKVSLRKACAVSLVVHLCALAALASWSIHRQLQQPVLGGSSGVVAIEATYREPDTQPLSSVTFTQEQVLILPDRAEMSRRHYVDTPAVRVPLSELLSRETLDRLAQANVQRELTPPSIERESLPELALASSDQPQEPRLTRRPTTRTPLLQVKARVAPAAMPPVQIGIRRGPSFAGNQPPRYPAIAKANGWEGKVMLRLTISDTGRVARVEVARSSGHPMLDAAAASAVRTWRGTPATLDGKPVETVELLPVRFRLK